MELPELPVPIDRYLAETAKCKTQAAIRDATKAFVEHESKLREIFAQYPDHPAAKQDHVLPLFNTSNPTPVVRARDLTKEPEEVRDQYLLALSADERLVDGAPAIVHNIGEFKTNFNLFSESSLIDLDWSNVIAAGSSVVTALLPVPSPHNESKRALRNYYHQILAPASDVDLFIYGLNEKQAVEKVKHIERAVRDSILSETTTIRTKNAITIVSEYPTRHVQIVLRLYRSITEILTGFDVDCSCVAYDGKQVWATPRSMAAYMTQLNTIDLTRRSPSYENRLSKYSHRGFEVFWPALDRSRIDPTIYERSFSRVLGLARLLVLEKLPHPNDRDTYLAKRREERGRPALPWHSRHRHALKGNVKDSQPDDVAEWVEEDEVSNYHTFTVPYGPNFNAKKIEKLLFTKDLLLNAEWNKPKDRETNLHRHPAFFGSVDDVIHDCCGFCPKPESDDDFAALEEERKIYISGDVEFLKDDPGRQAIGSFRPLTNDDWTEQAYVGNTTVLCQAIVDCDLEAVEDWFSNGELEKIDVNRRDHAGRTPLLLAAMCSTPEIVQFLIDHDARIVSRLYNGLTALHIAAFRGETKMVKALCDRSEANETEEDRKEEARKTIRRAAAVSPKKQEEPEFDSEVDSELVDTDDDSSDEMTEGSFVKVSQKNVENEDDKDEPDVYNIDVLAWDSPLSPLHLAIIAGRIEVVQLLTQAYGADVLLPVKILSTYDRTPQSAILTLTLALQQPLSQACETIGTLLSEGAISTQADMKGVSALHYAIADAKEKAIRAMEANTDPAALKKAANHVAVTDRRYWSSGVEIPLITAIRTKQLDVMQHLLEIGAQPEVDFESFAKSWDIDGRSRTHEDTEKEFKKIVEQPLVVAVQEELPRFAMQLIEAGADVNVCPKAGHQFLAGQTYNNGDKSVRDLVAERIAGLKKWLREQSEHADQPKSPPDFAPDNAYLNYPKGSYQHWTAVNNLERAKEVNAYQIKEYQRQVKLHQTLLSDVSAEKKAAVESMLENMEALYAKMVKNGAKGFRDLFPDAPKANEHNYRHGSRNQQELKEPYKTVFDFIDSALTDTKRNSYLKLFEAAWEGDIDVVKSLTLKSDQPLPIAVQDSAGFSPFSIAMIRGHTDLARAIVEIATVQYKPDDNKHTYRYRLKGRDDESEYDSDCSSEHSDDDVRVLAEIVDAKFTVDDIATLADTVKSKVSPLQMIEWRSEYWRAHNEKAKAAKQLYEFPHKHYYAYNVDDAMSWQWVHNVIPQESSRCSSSQIRHAIVKNDMNMLKFLIHIRTELAAQKEQDDEGSKNYDVPADDFDLAITLGRIEILGEIIASTGAAIPLQTMVKTSGVRVDEKPKYYQGLTVHGQKRQDWVAKSAARGTGRGRQVSAEVNYSLILRSIFRGNLHSAEYFLSDAPLRRYLEYAERLKTDMRVATLAQAKGGVEGALSTWLSTRSELSLHAAIMTAPKGDGTTPMFEYLLKAMPNLVEAKDKNGNTALLNAFKLRRIGVAQALLKVGANQVARNAWGENVLHIILNDGSYVWPEVLHTTLALLDPKLIPGMLMEKSTSADGKSNTPLALLLSNGRRNDAFRVCEVVFRYSGGKDLEVLNGAGDYLLHTLVRENHELLVKQLVDFRPEMLHWENATGMTPIDVAETSYMRDLIENPPKVGESHTTSVINQPDRDFTTENAKSADDLVLEELEAFIAGDDSDNLEGRRPPWRMNRLLQRLAVKYKGKRKLVSVLDANEVAKRLALQQQKRNEETRRQERLGLHAQGMSYRSRYGYNDRSGQATQDEVSMWWNEANTAKKWDWERWVAEVKGQEFIEDGEEAGR